MKNDLRELRNISFTQCLVCSVIVYDNSVLVKSGKPNVMHGCHAKVKPDSRSLICLFLLAIALSTFRTEF